MRRTILTLSALTLAAALVGPAAAGGDGGAPRLASARGVATIGGHEAMVDVVVAVRPGRSAAAEAARALEAQGARPVGSAAIGSSGFATTGLVWDALPVAQHYNPAGEAVAAQAAFQSAQQTWNDVATSAFEATFAGTTTRCPSLVKECPGPQSFDGFNDVGWARIGGNTLAVTWWGTTIDESDMGFNTRFAWSTGCVDVANSIDVETVALHEEGHVVGLDHYETVGSIMQASYSTAQCGLGSDDVEGATYLYPTQTATITGTVTGGGAAIEGATVSLGATGLSDQTDASGAYSIPGVPFPVTYDLSASASGFASQTVRETVASTPWAQDFVLEASGGGGGGPPCDKKPDHPNCR